MGMDMHLFESNFMFGFLKRDIANSLPFSAPLVEAKGDALLAAAEAVVVGGAAGRVETHVPLRVANLEEKRLVWS